MQVSIVLPIGAYCRAWPSPCCRWSWRACRWSATRRTWTTTPARWTRRRAGSSHLSSFARWESDQNSIFQGRLNVPGKKGRKLSKLESFPLINWELFVSCEIDWSKVKLFGWLALASQTSDHFFFITMMRMFWVSAGSTVCCKLSRWSDVWDLNPLLHQSTLSLCPFQRPENQFWQY